MSLYCAVGSSETDLTSEQMREHLESALRNLGPRKRILAVPPDQTRAHSRAGELTRMAWHYYGDDLKAILPALGTHNPMRDEQIRAMYGDVPLSLFRTHNWRSDIETVGIVPAEFIEAQSEGKLHYEWPAQVNRLLLQGDFDLILSLGQVVPHEVIGMANYNKNILVGTGGREGIHRSHYLGAVYGMERILGRTETPVRAVLNYASEHFLKPLPIVYVLTVVGRRADGGLALRGLLIGDDVECFSRAAELSLQVNFEIVDRPIHKALVYLDPAEFQSTWLGNKAIYRTRMALADGAELIIVGPGVHEFGEDKTIDRLIRTHGYRGTKATLRAVKADPELARELSAAAHLIHGSSEGRFRITWCAGKLSAHEVTSAGFSYVDPSRILDQYPLNQLKDGWNRVDGEEIFYISNPALGLWAHRDRLT